MGCMISIVLWLRMFFGMKPFFFIADADLLKDITVKHFDKFANRLVSDCTWVIYDAHQLLDSSMLVERGWGLTVDHCQARLIIVFTGFYAKIACNTRISVLLRLEGWTLSSGKHAVIEVEQTCQQLCSNHLSLSQSFSAIELASANAAWFAYSCPLKRSRCHNFDICLSLDQKLHLYTISLPHLWYPSKCTYMHG